MLTQPTVMADSDGWTLLCEAGSVYAEFVNTGGAFLRIAAADPGSEEVHGHFFDGGDVYIDNPSEKVWVRAKSDNMHIVVTWGV